jgi:hypothetical protein
MNLTIKREPGTTPVYELRVRRHPEQGLILEIWLRPSPNSPQLKEPLYVAGLGGRNLSRVEHRALRRLAKAGSTGRLPIQERQTFSLGRGPGPHPGVMFRVLAPMRNRDNIRMFVEA